MDLDENPQGFYAKWKLGIYAGHDAFRSSDLLVDYEEANGGRRGHVGYRQFVGNVGF